jgi:hypothetical protein
MIGTETGAEEYRTLEGSHLHLLDTCMVSIDRKAIGERSFSRSVLRTFSIKTKASALKHLKESKRLVVRYFYSFPGDSLTC